MDFEVVFYDFIIVNYNIKNNHHHSHYDEWSVYNLMVSKKNMVCWSQNQGSTMVSLSYSPMS